MNNTLAIKVDRVYKEFRLPHEKVGSVKNIFTNLLGNIRKRRTYETQHALRDISFEVKKGEFFGVVGRNGSGKSTLLKMLAEIYQPTKGSVAVDGRLIPFIELGVGFNAELTGRENVYLNGALIGFSKTEIDGMYEEIVAFAELEQFMDQKLKNYSSGMQVRLAFSLAIRSEADILLVDEVLAVGDADFQRKCFRYFKQLKKEKKTVVFVTHDMNAVREYCDRAAFIEKSELVSVGSPEKISKMYEQLLMPRANNEIVTSKTNRWGDGSLKITTANVTHITNEKITLSLTIQAQNKCDDPIFGFVVRNGAGTPLLGTNTMLQKTKITPMKERENKKIAWSFYNALADGDYTVTFAAQYDNGVTNGDWWEDACKFRITKARHSPYLVDPEITTEVE